MRLQRLLPCLVLFIAAGCFSDPGSAPTNNDEDNAQSNSASNGATNASNNATPGCLPSNEVCDGEDNDCDGEVDEDFDLGVACNVGIGACEASGQQVCTAAGDAVECDAQPSSPGDELCEDSIDNDCDGEVDEGFADIGEDCVEGQGVCATTGTVVCSDDLLTTMCDAVPPMPPEADEVTCDGLDNDCDSLADEGCDDDGDGFCDANFAIESPGADPICTAGGGDCDDDDDVVYPGAPGLCDGKDNDCADGVDDIKRSASHTFALADFASTDLEHSPVQAIASAQGFCFYMTGGTAGARTITRGHFATSTDTLVEGTSPSTREEFVVDVEWTGSQCAALVVELDGDATRDARLRRWTATSSNGAARLAVNDGIGHIAGSWDAAMAFINGTYVIAYATTSGSDASYVTLPSNFDSFTNASAVNDVGLNGTFPELGLNPAMNELLFASNFFNLNVHQFDVGDLASQVSAMTLTSSVNRAETVINTIGTDTWMAVRHGGMNNVFEIRSVTDVPEYGLVGSVTYASAIEAQDYIGRNLFAGGPAGAFWFIDPIDEEIAILTDDTMGGLAVTELVDVMGAGHMLAARQVSSDVSEVLWLTSPGDAANNATFEVAEYTCH